MCDVSIYTMKRGRGSLKNQAYDLKLLNGLVTYGPIQYTGYNYVIPVSEHISIY